jgi:hypothetical protein
LKTQDILILILWTKNLQGALEETAIILRQFSNPLQLDMKCYKGKSTTKGKKFFNIRDKINMINLSFEGLHNISNIPQKKKSDFPSLVTKEELDEDILLLGKL